MYNSYYFLKQVSKLLEAQLHGFTLVSCFSQTRDELVIEFNDAQRSFFIRASLLPELCCVTFPSRFNRARKNSVDLFSPLLMQKVTGIRQFSNERSFQIHLTNDYSLLFKMHGRQSNVLLLVNDNVKDLFRTNLKSDLALSPDSLDRELPWTREYFDTSKDQKTAYFTFGKEIWTYLQQKGFDKSDGNHQWDLLLETHQLLEDPSYYIISDRGKRYFSLLEFGRTIRKFDNPFEAVNDFVSTSSAEQAFDKEKSALASSLHSRSKKAAEYIERSNEKLEQLLLDDHYQVWGDLVMANLVRIKQGDSQVEVENLYDNNALLVIKLNRQLSAQRNAEVFYRKAKNRSLEVEKLRDRKSVV